MSAEHILCDLAAGAAVALLSIAGTLWALSAVFHEAFKRAL